MSDGSLDYEKFLPDINLKEGISRIMNKEKLYLTLLGKFKLREMANDIAAKINGGAGAEDIRNAAHALKGSSANLSMPVVTSAALLIEEEAKKGNTGAEHLGRLNEAVEALEAKINLLLGK